MDTDDLYVDVGVDSSDNEYYDGDDSVEDEAPSFVGKSSSVSLVNFAVESRNSVIGSHPKSVQKSFTRREEYWRVQSVRSFSSSQQLNH